jgi:HEPN domain-containing protein
MMAKPHRYIEGSRAVWLAQAQNDAKVARCLLESGNWSDAILHGFDAIEKALKAAGQAGVLYEQLEASYGELRVTYAKLQGKVKPVHRPEEIIGPQHSSFPPKLLESVKALDMEKERLRLKYPTEDSQRAPYELASESKARVVLDIVDQVMQECKTSE